MKNYKALLLEIIIISSIIMQCFGGSVAVADSGTVIAGFSYSGGTIKTDFDDGQGGSKSGGYGFNSGMLAANAKVFASVDGESFRKLEWTDSNYSGVGAGTGTVCAMTAGTGNAWGTAPYFMAKFSTKSYENVTFSAALGGSKKGPANYKMMYSIDGASFYDLANSSFSLSTNKTMIPTPTASLPENTWDASEVYIKIVATGTKIISGSTSFVGATGGEAAINDIVITGVYKEAVQKLPSNTSSISSNSEILSDDTITLSNPSSTASIYYSVNNGDTLLYTEPITPFLASDENQVTIRTWATEDGYEDSEAVSYTYSCTEDNIVSFKYGKAPKNLNEWVAASSGTYPTGRIYASANGVDSFVPMFDKEKGAALSIAPDDTLTWGENGGWRFKVSTAGYDNVNLSMRAYSSKKGPKSMTLKYSLDGINFVDIEKNKDLPVSGFGDYYTKYALPTAVCDKELVYLGLFIEEDMRADATDTAPLFWNESKGNTYINNIVFSGKRNNTPKMPYTTKKTDYFGESGTIEYGCSQNLTMKYNVYDRDYNLILENQEYTAPISPISFNSAKGGKYTIDIWSEKNGEKSKINSKTYSYKGDLLASFTAGDSSIDGKTILLATEGTGELSMYPNGDAPQAMTYYKDSICVGADDNNQWSFDKTRAASEDDGYWLIKTSTRNYKDILLSQKQISTEKGPRDFILSYSTDGINFSQIEKSKVRLGESLNDAYSNLKLPKNAENQETLYIKVKLDGGENVLGLELDGADDPTVVGKGNTGINEVEITGTKMTNGISLAGADAILSYNKEYTVNADILGDGVIIVSGYNNNGGLVFIQTGKNKFTVPPSSNAEKIKVMLWENILSAKPLCSVIEKEIK